MIRRLALALGLLLALALPAQAVPYFESIVPPKVAPAPIQTGNIAPRSTDPVCNELRLKDCIEKISFSRWAGGVAPLWVTDPFQTLTYQCVRTFWVNTTGSDANAGTSVGSPWLHPSHYFTGTTPAYGDCVNVIAGSGATKTYTDNIIIPGTIVGGATTTTGWVVFRATDTSGNSVRAAKGPTLNTSIAKIVSALDDGTAVFGANGLIDHVVFDGFEVACHASPASPFEAAFQFSNGSNGPNLFTGNHIAVIYNHVHDCPSGGFGAGGGDFYWIQWNNIHNTSFGDPFATSGISFAQMRHKRSLIPQGYDALMPWKNLVAGNVVYNILEYNLDPNNPPGSRSDGECLILDDEANAQGAGAGTNETNAGLYWLTTGVFGNLFFNCGGNGIQMNDAWYNTIAFNTVIGDFNDTGNPATARVGIFEFGGDYNQFYANIVQGSGPYTQVTQGLASPGTVLDVADVRGFAQYMENVGSFEELIHTVGGGNSFPVLINGTANVVTAFTVDAVNTCASFPAVAPGCVSGTITLQNSVSTTDGALFSNVFPQTSNNVANGCTGDGAVGAKCSPLGFNGSVESSQGRFGSPVPTCSGAFTTPATCPPVNIPAIQAHSFYGANLTQTTNGGGGFNGLNNPNISVFPGSTPTVLGNNITGDPGLNNPTWLNADILAGAGSFGPAFLIPASALPPPPPNLALLAASAAIGAGAKPFYPNADGSFTNVPYCPSVDITGAARNCGALDIGAYAFSGSPLNFVGIADVANVPSPLMYWGTVAASKRAATGRQPALAINCNATPGTAYVIYINTVGQLDDAAVEAVCSGYEAGSNIVHVSRAFEQIFNQRECDLQQPTAANQPTLAFNLVSNKSVLKFSGTQWLQLAIVNSDQFCGVMFAQPTYLTVAESTFGSGISAVMDNGGGDGTLGFGSATTGYFTSEGVTLTPSGTDQTHYFALIGAGVGNALPITPSTTGFISIDSPSTGTTTSNSFGSTIWQNLFTWGRQQSAASFTGVMVGTTTLTVTNVTSGIGASVIKPGQTVTAAGLAGGTTILTQLTGTIGGAGDYQLSASATFSAEPVTSSFVGNALTGFSPIAAIYGTPVSISDPNPQVRAVALTQPQAQAVYTLSLKPNFGLPYRRRRSGREKERRAARRPRRRSHFVNGDRHESSAYRAGPGTFRVPRQRRAS